MLLHAFNFLYFLLKISINPTTLPQFSHFYYLCAEYSEIADAECPAILSAILNFSCRHFKSCGYTVEPRKTKGQVSLYGGSFPYILLLFG